MHAVTPLVLATHDKISSSRQLQRSVTNGRQLDGGREGEEDEEGENEHRDEHERQWRRREWWADQWEKQKSDGEHQHDYGGGEAKVLDHICIRHS